MTTTTLETISAALAAASTVTYKVSERDHHEHGAILVLDSSGSDVAEDGSDDAAVRAAMGGLGFEFVDSGANGGPEGGYYSYWRAVAAEETDDAEDTSKQLRALLLAWQADGVCSVEDNAGAHDILDLLTDSAEDTAEYVHGDDDTLVRLDAHGYRESVWTYRAVRCCYTGCDAWACDEDPDGDVCCHRHAEEARQERATRRVQIQVSGEWAGTSGGWRPAIDGTLNQTGEDPAEASTFTGDVPADVVEMVREQRPEAWRIVTL